MPETANIWVILFAFIEFVLLVLVGVLGWTLKTIFRNFTEKLDVLTETLEEMTERFFEHQIVDAGQVERINQMRHDINNHTERLNRHSDKIDQLEGKCQTFEHEIKRK